MDNKDIVLLRFKPDTGQIIHFYILSFSVALLTACFIELHTVYCASLITVIIAGISYILSALALRVVKRRMISDSYNSDMVSILDSPDSLLFIINMLKLELVFHLIRIWALSSAVGLIVYMFIALNL